MNSTYIKTVLCSYFRFANGSKYVATEAGGFNSDVLAVKKGIVYEVEVKISKADLSQDFKKDKHRIYETYNRSSGKYLYRHVPNYFYFAVPKELAEFALTKTLGTKYGVMVIIGENEAVMTDRRRHVGKNYVEKVLNEIKEDGGIITSVEESRFGSNIFYKEKALPSWENRVRIVKRATKIHNDPASRELLFSLHSRTSSELANLKIQNYLLKKGKQNGNT